MTRESEGRGLSEQDRAILGLYTDPEKPAHIPPDSPNSRDALRRALAHIEHLEEREADHRSTEEALAASIRLSEKLLAQVDHLQECLARADELAEAVEGRNPKAAYLAYLATRNPKEES